MRDVDTGTGLLERDFSVPANRNTTVGSLKPTSAQQVWLIEWSNHEGRMQYNHYLVGEPPFDPGSIPGLAAEDSRHANPWHPRAKGWKTRARFGRVRDEKDADWCGHPVHPGRCFGERVIRGRPVLEDRGAGPDQ